MPMTLPEIEEALSQAKDALYLAEHQDHLGGHRDIKYWSDIVNELTVTRNKMLRQAFS